MLVRPPVALQNHVFFMLFNQHRVITHALYFGPVFCHGKPEGLYHLLKFVHGAVFCQMLLVRRDNLPGSHVRKMHLCHASHKHLFMHSSISPMVDVRVVLHAGLFHSSEHGIKSNTFVQEKVISSQNQELRGHQSARVGAIDGSTSTKSLSQSLW